MGGILVVLQLLIANRRAYAMEETAKAQAKATQEQAKANENTEQGQRQERLKNAIEHLGHESDSVRLGGAYELFHLAEDTEDLGQRQTVLDILCAHIRRTTREAEYKKEYPSKPSEEIQSLLTLFFRQKHKVFIGLDINLEGSWLNGSNLNQARLEKADLSEAQLHGTNLRGAQLRRANLRGARLHGADLSEARLHGANLRGAQLYGADLSRAQLYGADLLAVQLHGADLMLARLYGADLLEAQLHGANLMLAQLYGADLLAAQLYGANLRGAQLYGARLLGARLHGVDLSEARLHGASSIYPGELDESFEAFINKRIGECSDLSGAIFEGGLIPEDVASIGKGLPDDKEAMKLRAKLEVHIGKPESRDLPENSGAIKGKYTKEEAAQWIAEYKTATAEVAKGDS